MPLTPEERLARLASRSEENTPGVVTLPGSVAPGEVHTVVHGEQFTANGLLTTYALAHPPLYGVSVFVAGVRTDVTLNGANMTFAVAPALNALIRVDYEYV